MGGGSQADGGAGMADHCHGRLQVAVLHNQHSSLGKPVRARDQGNRRWGCGEQEAMRSGGQLGGLNCQYMCLLVCA